MADDVGRGRHIPAATGRRYAAFISYSHRDEEFGDWLHKRLESYQVPSPLVGRETSAGAIGKRLGKVFRDRADLSAAHDLGREIREGLENSDALIVLCSPRSCGSKYVHEEIRTFKELGKGQRIFAAIIDGEPHAAGRPGYTAADECFPPSLIYALGRDGQISSQLEPNEPIAADFREGKDGRENGSLKIIAGLLDVGLDELVQREKQAERARRRRANLIAAAMAVLALGAIGAGTLAWLKQNEALRNFQLAEHQRGVAEERAIAERAARAEAEQNAREREEQRGIALTQAELAHTQEIIALANAAEATAQRDAARAALGEIFEDRAWQLIDRGSFPLAARYVLAGWREAPDNSADFAAALGRILHEAGESRPLIGDPTAPRPSSSSDDARAILSADGARILTTNSSDIARVWDVASGRHILSLPGFLHVSAAAFSPDGMLALVVDGNSRARLWDLRPGVPNEQRLITILRSHDEDTGLFASASFSDDSRRLVTSDEHVAHIWDVTLGVPDDQRELAVLRHAPNDTRRGRVRSAEFSRDGARVVTAYSDGAARIWNAAPGVPDEQRQLAVLRGHEEGVLRSASFSPDGARIVTCGADSTARLWNAAPGVRDDRRQIAVLQHAATDVTSASFSNDGARVVTTARLDTTAHIWNAAPNVPDDQREVVTLRGHTSSILGAKFSADGTRVVTASADNSARVWDAASAVQIAVLRGHESDVTEASFTPDGAHVATASADNTARIWDATTGGLVADTRGLGETYRAMFTPDGNGVTLQGETLRVWTPSTRAIETPQGYEGRILDVSFGANGMRVVTAAPDNTVRIWDATYRRDVAVLRNLDASLDESARAEISVRNGVAGALQAASLNPDGTQIVLKYAGAAHVWDVASDRELAVLRGDERVWPVSGRRIDRLEGAWFSPDGARIAAAHHRGILVWESTPAAPASWRRLAELRHNDENIESPIFRPAFTTVGVPRIVTASGADLTPRVWDAARDTPDDRRQLLVLRGHPSVVVNVAYSPDATRIATASLDGSARLWNAVSGRQIAMFSTGSPLRHVAFSPNGARLVTTSDDGVARLWDISRLVQPMEELARTACSTFLIPYGRHFSSDETGDPLIRDVWLGENRQDRDVCEGMTP